MSGRVSVDTPTDSGNHTVDVRARLIAGEAANLSGSASNALQRGALTVMILKTWRSSADRGAAPAAPFRYPAGAMVCDVGAGPSG